MTELLDWTLRVEVTDHVRERARNWLGWDDPQDIRAEVRDALLFDRVCDRVPNWTRGTYTYSAGPRSDGVFYLWNEPVTRCWVVSKGLYAGVPCLYVRTILLDHDVEVEITERRRTRRA